MAGPATVRIDVTAGAGVTMAHVEYDSGDRTGGFGLLRDLLPALELADQLAHASPTPAAAGRRPA
jgi:hypothetical protein